MKINGTEVIGDKFFFDGCHKIYIIEDSEDIETMETKNWTEEDIYPIDELEEIYHDSCSLRFISNCKLDKSYVGQFVDEDTVIFTN
jgi:hypothetical protein